MSGCIGSASLASMGDQYYWRAGVGVYIDYILRIDWDSQHFVGIFLKSPLELLYE
jgi:hypothetical protein